MLELELAHGIHKNYKGEEGEKDDGCRRHGTHE